MSNPRQAETRAIIEACGALIEDDHFVYASGAHGNGWIAKDIINLDPRLPRRLGELLAEAVSDIPCDVICGPVMGGLICAQFTALALSTSCIYAEREQHDGKERVVLKRGHDSFVKNKRVLVVDDVVNTGYSMKLTMEAVRQAGGEVVGAAAWISRGNVGASDLGVDSYIFLDEVSLPSWPAEGCRLCEAGVPVNTTYAHGAEFAGSA
ncbi:MAG: phosphoribosyltransferase family protein [Planctomycetota bacterium]|nr:phosphoribosyltransferase family protein [Planctomycetota bacterium]